MIKKEELDLTLKDFFLSTEFPISEVGLFVGAGSSCEAGYPLTWELTKEVYKQLDGDELRLLQEILSANDLEIDVDAGYPDIEATNDHIMKNFLEAPSDNKSALQEKIKRKTLAVFKWREQSPEGPLRAVLQSPRVSDAHFVGGPLPVT